MVIAGLLVISISEIKSTYMIGEMLKMCENVLVFIGDSTITLSEARQPVGPF